jgi:hypothetical protein
MSFGSDVLAPFNLAVCPSAAREPHRCAKVPHALALWAARPSAVSDSFPHSGLGALSKAGYSGKAQMQRASNKQGSVGMAARSESAAYLAYFGRVQSGTGLTVGSTRTPIHRTLRTRLMGAG